MDHTKRQIQRDTTKYDQIQPIHPNTTRYKQSNHIKQDTIKYKPLAAVILFDNAKFLKKP